MSDQSSTKAPSRCRPWMAFLLDFVILVVFVAVGRRSHHLHSGLRHSLEVLWPFAVGLVAGWLVVQLHRSPLSFPRAAGAWLITVGLGMTLRLTMQDHAFMIGFTIVTTLFVGACMLGWRLVWRLAERASTRRRSRLQDAASLVGGN